MNHKVFLVAAILILITISAGCIGTAHKNKTTPTQTVQQSTSGNLVIHPITLHPQTHKTTKTITSTTNKVSFSNSTTFTTSTSTVSINDEFVSNVFSYMNRFSKIRVSHIQFDPTNTNSLYKYFSAYIYAKNRAYIQLPDYAMYQADKYTIILAYYKNKFHPLIDVNGIVIDYYVATAFVYGDVQKDLQYYSPTEYSVITIENRTNIIGVGTTLPWSNEPTFFAASKNIYFSYYYNDNMHLVEFFKTADINSPAYLSSISITSVYEYHRTTVSIDYSNGTLTYWSFSNSQLLTSSIMTMDFITDMMMSDTWIPYYSSGNNLVFVGPEYADHILIMVLTKTQDNPIAYTGKIYYIDTSAIYEAGEAELKIKANNSPELPAATDLMASLSNVPSNLDIMNFNDELTAMSIIDSLPKGASRIYAWLKMFSTLTYISNNGFEAFVKDSIIYFAGMYLNANYESPDTNETPDTATLFIYDGNNIKSSIITPTFSYTPLPKISFSETCVASTETNVLYGYYDGESITETIIKDNYMTSMTFNRDEWDGPVPMFVLDPVVFNDHEIIAYYMFGEYMVHATGSNYTYTGTLIYYDDDNESFHTGTFIATYSPES